MLGTPVLDDMDGKVLDHIFESPSKHEKVSSKSITGKRKFESKEGEGEDKEQIEKRLKNLGYI